MKDFCVGLFFAYMRTMRQSAPLLFDRTPRQENCLSPLFRPGSFAAKCRFDRDRCWSFLDALRILLSIPPLLLSTLSSRLLPTYAARDTGLFLSPFTLSEGKNDLCYWLIDRNACFDFCTRAFIHCLFSFNKASCISSRRKGLILQTKKCFWFDLVQ